MTCDTFGQSLVGVTDPQSAVISGFASEFKASYLVLRSFAVFAKAKNKKQDQTKIPPPNIRQRFLVSKILVTEDLQPNGGPQVIIEAAPEMSDEERLARMIELALLIAKEAAAQGVTAEDNPRLAYPLLIAQIIPESEVPN